MSIEIFVNGQAERTDATDLLAFLSQHIPGRGLSLTAAFACAVNNQFAPRAAWARTPLNDGDRIDLIAPITGG